jgi:hypothetical protein
MRPYAAPVRKKNMTIKQSCRVWLSSAKFTTEALRVHLGCPGMGETDRRTTEAHLAAMLACATLAAAIVALPAAHATLYTAPVSAIINNMQTIPLHGEAGWHALTAAINGQLCAVNRPVCARPTVL